MGVVWLGESVGGQRGRDLERLYSSAFVSKHPIDAACAAPHRRRRRHFHHRYALLPYLYTLFLHANATGAPIMRPLWYEFPEDPSTLGVQESFMLGGWVGGCGVEELIVLFCLVLFLFFGGYGRDGGEVGACGGCCSGLMGAPLGGSH